MLKNGNLKDFNFIDLISIISKTSKSGILEVSSDNIKSFIIFYNGNIINSHNNDAHGENLLFNISLKNEGNFTFIEQNTSNEEININKDIYEIIKDLSLKKEFIANLYDTNLYLNSEIKLLDFSTNDKLLEHLKDKNLSIIKFFEISKYTVSEFIKKIRIYKDNNQILILKTEDENTYDNLLIIINKLYSKFIEISGIKLNNDIDLKIKDLILLSNLNLILKNGKISNIDLFSYNTGKKIEKLKSFLEELVNYSVKIYGNGFIKNISKELNNDLETLIVNLL